MMLAKGLLALLGCVVVMLAFVAVMLNSIALMRMEREIRRMKEEELNLAENDSRRVSSLQKLRHQSLLDERSPRKLY